MLYFYKQDTYINSGDFKEFIERKTEGIVNENRYS